MRKQDQLKLGNVLFFYEIFKAKTIMDLPVIQTFLII